MILTSVADLNRSTRTLRARATKLIPPHEIEFSEGVSIFIRERKINIIMAHRIKDGQVRHAKTFDLLEWGHGLPKSLEIFNDEFFYQKL